jgi:hypothetical protein
VALWHLCLNLGSATKAGEGAVSVVVTMVIIWSIFITRSWRRRDEEASELWSDGRAGGEARGGHTVMPLPARRSIGHSPDRPRAQSTMAEAVAK